VGAAASTGPFVDVGSGRNAASYPVTGSAKVAWDTDNLYVLIEVKDADVLGYFTDKASQPKDWTVTGQPMTWNHDTAEIMIDPTATATTRTTTSSRSTREPRLQEPVRRLQRAEDASRRARSGTRTGTEDEVRGPGPRHDRQAGDKDEGYTVEAAIPWAAFEKARRTARRSPATRGA